MKLILIFAAVVFFLIFGPLVLLLIGVEHPPDPLNIGWSNLAGGGAFSG